MVSSYDFTEKNGGLEYKTQASAVYSSNIEGNSIDLNSFMNYKLSEKKFKPEKEIQEIEDLISAYQFAQGNKLNEKNFLESHNIFSKTLVIKSNRGKYRNEKVGVFGQSGLVYLAIGAEFVRDTMKEFFADIDYLLNKTLSNAHYFILLH